MNKAKSKVEAEIVQIQDTIETLVPTERLRGRSLTVLSTAVVVERLYAQVHGKPFDLPQAIEKVLNWKGIISDEH